MRIDEVPIDLARIFESSIDRALRDLIEHHAIRGLGWSLRNDLFSEVLADRFAFAIRVGGKIDRVGLFRSLLQFGNDLLVVSFLRIGNEFVGRFEIVLDVDTEALSKADL